MMYPTLREPASTRDYIETFGGYDHRDRIDENAFYDMENLSSDAFPAVGPRRKRGVRAESFLIRGATALLGGQNLAYAANGQLYVKDTPVMRLSNETPKKLIAMGAYIVVFPDKVYYNTAKPEDCGAMEANVFAANATVELCREDGTTYATAPVKSAAAPANPQNMDLWLDTSQTPHVLKQFAANTGLWTGLATTYFRISATGIGNDFSDGDAVRVDAAGFDFSGQTMCVVKREADSLVFVGLIEETKTAVSVRFRRQLPILDHVFECGNRLWGCRYGENADGEFVNEIYASALGDFKNWFRYQGVSTDSYAASVGSDGPFTGAIAYRGYPLFFKSDCLHKVYGAYPAAFQIQQYPGFRGVQNGSGGSLAILNEVLYYKSDHGVCAYDGSAATEMTEIFGGVSYSDAVAGAYNNKYYISMKSGEDLAWHLFAYDAQRGIWHREDRTKADSFAVSGTDLYYIEDGAIKSETGGGNTDEGPVEWHAETGDIGMRTPDQKTLTRLNLRLRLDPGSRMTIYIRYDDMPEWRHVCTLTGNTMRSFTLPVLPQRCDHFRLRFSGRGEFRLFSIAKTLEQGSDVV